MANILALDIAGNPRSWISYDNAIIYHAKGLVGWSLGEIIAKYRGGYQKSGERSYLETSSIIAIRGHGFNRNRRVMLTNKSLFARDRSRCCYCNTFHADHNELSRDHIIPKSHGGEDVWTNVVASCINCNQEKGCKTLKQAGMELLYVPYEPVHNEYLILQNRSILADQMDYLLPGVPKHSRLLDMAA